MNARIHHLLLVALFAVAHLFAQPLASTGSCMGAVEAGGECCCCLDEAAPSACSGGCGGDEDSDGSNDDEPSDSRSFDSGCNCVMTPPVPFAPERNQSTSFESGGGLAVFEADRNPLYSSIWPSLAMRAAQPPNQPPRVDSRAAAAFTQVFRL